MIKKEKLRILVVDDYVKMRAIIKNSLRKLGYHNIDEAENGTRAFTKLKTERFDFVISDWNMPKMSGLDLLKAVRADPDTMDIPFLMITAEALSQNIVSAVKAGVDNYIVKPFTEATLEEKIDAIFKKRG